jgi:lysophospholipase L1-like esterase
MGGNMRRLLLALILLSLMAGPAAAQLGSTQAQKLYEEAATVVERGPAAPGQKDRLIPLMERLHSPRGWNNTADVYELLQFVRAHQAMLHALPATKATEELDSIAARLDSHLRGLLAAVERRVRNPDRDNLARYAPANDKLPPPASGEQRVLFLGDSITDGWKLAEYFLDKPYVNRGISGQITGEMLGRMKADVLNLKPAAMVVLAGTNDLARGVAVEVIENNLSMIGDLARANDIKPIFASILPVSDYARDRPAQTPQRPPEKIREINAWLQSYCKAKGFEYLDYFPALADEKGLLKAELADDGLHPNAAGYKVMAPLAQAVIDKVLAPPPAPPRRRR